MTLTELAQLLNQHRDSSGNLLLESSWLPVAGTLSTYVDQDNIQLNGTQEATVQDDTVVMPGGNANILGVTNAEASLVGRIDSDHNPQLELAIKNFTDWSFDKTCPGLPDSMFDDNGIIIARQSFFYSYDYVNPYFIITTAPYHITEVNFPNVPTADSVQDQPGIHFLTEINLANTDITQKLATYLPEAYQNSLSFAGLIDLQSGETKMIRLLAPMSDFSIAGIISVSGLYFSLHIQPDQYDPSVNRSAMHLKGNIPIQGSESETTAYLTASMLQSDYIWTLAVTFDTNPESGNLNTLTQAVFGKSGLGDALPLPSMIEATETDFSLSALTLGYHPKTQKFGYFALAVVREKDWTSPYSRLMMKDFGILWVLTTQSANNNQFDYYGDLYSTFLIGDPHQPEADRLLVDLTACIPGNTGNPWSFAGQADFEDEEGNIVPKPLADIFDNLFGNDHTLWPEYPNAMNDLKLYQFSAMAVPSESLYDFSGGILWEISESATFYLDWSISLSLGTSNPEEDLQVTGAISGTLDNESPQLNIVKLIPLLTGGQVSAPQGMNITLNKASLFTILENKSLVLTAESDNYGSAAAAVSKKDDTHWKAMFGLATNIDFTLNLSGIPLIGGALSTDADLHFQDLRLSIATDTFTAEELNVIVPESYPGKPASFSTQDVPKGLALSTTIALASQTFPAMVSVMSDQGQWDIDAASPVSAKKTDWQQTSSQLGPLTLNKIGVEYRSGSLWASVDASLDAGPMKLDLYGFSLGSSLQNFSPAIQIKGLGLAFKGGPLAISGRFLAKDPTGAVQDDFTYYGSAMLKSQCFSLTAQGIYSKLNGTPSLFLFMMLNKKFGGPPYFFVDGIAAGFAYNRGLAVPNINALMKFPLIQAALNSPDNPIQSQDPIDALTVLDEGGWVPQEVGKNWLAAGIRFSSFEIVKSFALMSTTFGTDVNVRLMGNSTLIAPKGTASENAAGKKPIVRAQMALLAGFDPNEGAIKIDANLTPASYVITPDCQLLGGFAFYSWFSGDNAGDFVITMGGYSPFFTNKPNHYPDVPRLSINWQVSNHLSIMGQEYFALTPTCIMAGGSLAAMWKSGNISAFFTAYADFFLSWEPYHYVAEVGISIGVSVRIKINYLFGSTHKTFHFSLGADMHIEGPEFYVKAKIRLWIVTFTISHGSKPQPPAFLTWAEFQNSFLPVTGDQYLHPFPADGQTAPRFDAAKAPKEVVDVMVTGGLIKELLDTDSPERTIKGWIINPAEFELVTRSVIPSKDYSLPNNTTVTPTWTTQLSIGPMGIPMSDFTSTHTIDILDNNGETLTDTFISFSPNLDKVPKTLWEENTNPNAKPNFNQSEQVIPNALTGFTLKPMPEARPFSETTVLAERLFFDSRPLQLKFNAAVTIPEPQTFPDGPQAEISKTIKNNATRKSILSELASTYGFELDQTCVVDNLSNGGGNLINFPELALLGQEKMNAQRH